jgi:hypothetical protein
VAVFVHADQHADGNQKGADRPQHVQH